MTWEMYEALGNLCQRAEDTPDIRVLILRGAGGKAFVAGTDISQFRGFRSSEDGIAYEERLDAIIECLETVTIPTIAQINGVAAGGGCAIAAACDLRVCTTSSRLGVPVAKTLGNCLSAANYSRFLDLVGPTRLKEMLYTGRLIPASEALAAGLVNQVVDAEDLDNAVLELAETIAANAPLTIRATKEMIRRIQAQRRLAAAEGHDLITACYTSVDFKQGVEAFLAKKKPQWQGK
jgi:enoyl-CoA hydratase/carnithine racemase